MPATFFLVRATAAPELRDKFDHWYATDHVPWAIRVFKCEKAWRFWSEVEERVHYAVYRFADKAACDAALASDDFKALVADSSPHLARGRHPRARRGDAGGGAGGLARAVVPA